MTLFPIPGCLISIGIWANFELKFSEIDKNVGPVLPCDDGWVLHLHHCVKVNLDKLNWFQAEESCNVMGGHLISIHGENYNQFVTGLFNSMSNKIIENLFN